MNRRAVVRTILSGLLFSVPFLFSQYVGFLVLFFMFPLLFLLRSASWMQAFLYGLIWGGVAYGLHFVWLLDLLIKKSQAGLLLAIFLYVAIVCYASFTSALWFFLTKLLRVSIIVTGIVYFFVLHFYMFWMFGEGYPFLNPCLPLMEYVPSKVIFMPKQEEVLWNDYKFIYLKPCEEKGDRNRATRELYRNLKAAYHKHKLTAQKDASQKICLLGPETTYQFAPTPSTLELLGSSLEDAELLFGALRNHETSHNAQYQTVYWLTSQSSSTRSIWKGKGLIIKSYDKQHRVAFVERIPWFWKSNRWALDLFIGDRCTMARGLSSQEKFFGLGASLRIRPFICSELFFLPWRDLFPEGDLSKFSIVFVNDSWFCPYFRRILALSASFRFLPLDCSLLYVGHLG